MSNCFKVAMWSIFSFGRRTKISALLSIWSGMRWALGIPTQTALIISYFRFVITTICMTHQMYYPVWCGLSNGFCVIPVIDSLFFFYRRVFPRAPFILLIMAIFPRFVSAASCFSSYAQVFKQNWILFSSSLHCVILRRVFFSVKFIFYRLFVLFLLLHRLVVLPFIVLG